MRTIRKIIYGAITAGAAYGLYSFIMRMVSNYMMTAASILG